MIKRDKNDIIIQHDPFEPTYEDGGDSAARTGMMALCGSLSDKGLLKEFIIAGKLVRHPHQSPYNCAASTSRDQLIQYVAGFVGTRRQADLLIVRGLLYNAVTNFFRCQNTHKLNLLPKLWYEVDILTPSHLGYLIKVGKISWLYWLLPICNLWLVFDILFSADLRPFDEPNQIIALCSSSGDWALRLYCKLNKNWKRGIAMYWSNWRDQEEIGIFITNYVTSRIK